MVAPDQAAVQRVIDDAYGKLGLPRGASTEKIKRAYHKLALRIHPDKQQPGSNAVGIEGEPNMGSGEPEPNLSNGDAHDVELNAASPMGMPAPLTPATDGAVEAAFDGFHAPPPTSKFSPSAEPVE